MSAGEGQEKVTIQGSDFWTRRKNFESPRNLEYPGSLMIDVTDPSLVPPNYQDAGAGTWKLIQGGPEAPNPSNPVPSNHFSIEVSKRRRPMPFWHRNLDNDELVICVQGSALWETEIGSINLKAGQMILIPRGVAHKVSAEEKSNYIAIEIKAPTLKALQAAAQRT